MWQAEGSSKFTVCWQSPSHSLYKVDMCGKSDRTRKPSIFHDKWSSWASNLPFPLLEDECDWLLKSVCPLNHTHSVEAKEVKKARTSSWYKRLISMLAANVGRQHPIRELQLSIWCNHHWDGGTDSLGLEDVWRTKSTKMFINKTRKTHKD